MNCRPEQSRGICTMPQAVNPGRHSKETIKIKVTSVAPRRTLEKLQADPSADLRYVVDVSGPTSCKKWAHILPGLGAKLKANAQLQWPIMGLFKGAGAVDAEDLEAGWKSAASKEQGDEIAKNLMGSGALVSV